MRPYPKNFGKKDLKKCAYMPPKLVGLKLAENNPGWRVDLSFVKVWRGKNGKDYLCESWPNDTVKSKSKRVKEFKCFPMNRIGRSTNVRRGVGY